MKKIVSILLTTAVILLIMASCSGTNERVYYNYDLTPYVTLGRYKGIKVDLLPEEISEQRLQKEINEWLNFYGYSKVEDVLDRDVVQKGDVVNIDFDSTSEGVMIEGGTEKARNIRIGSNEMNEEFENKLIGAKVGTTVTFAIVFPRSLKGNILAGKEVEFIVKINKIRILVYDELTDPLVFKMTDGENFTTYEFKEYIREYLTTDIKNINTDLIWSKVVENCQINGYPQIEIDTYIEDTINSYKRQAESYGLTYEEFLYEEFGKTVAEIVKETKENAEQNISKEMIAYSIAEKEGITVTDSLYEEGLKNHARKYGFKEIDLEKRAGKEQIKKWILIEQVLEFVLKNVQNP